jgi:hypothetical protein
VAISTVGLVAGCGIFEPAWVQSNVDGRVFSHPASWQVQRPLDRGAGAPHFRQLFYVGNVTVGPECLQLEPNEFDCGEAIPPLESGDVVISWAVGIGLGGGLLSAPANLTVDDHEALLEVSDDPTGFCANADFAASLEILTSDHSNESIFYCSRGATQREALQTFERFIEGIDIGRVGLG